jgi:hypothetical protein
MTASGCLFYEEGFSLASCSSLSPGRKAPWENSRRTQLQEDMKNEEQGKGLLLSPPENSVALPDSILP